MSSVLLYLYILSTDCLVKNDKQTCCIGDSLNIYLILFLVFVLIEAAEL